LDARGGGIAVLLFCLPQVHVQNSRMDPKLFIVSGFELDRNEVQGKGRACATTTIEERDKEKRVGDMCEQAGDESSVAKSGALWVFEFNEG